MTTVKTIATPVFIVLCFSFWWSVAAADESSTDVVPTDMTLFKQRVAPFLASYCGECHGPDAPEAGFSIHDIDGMITNGKDDIRWVKTLEMLSIRDMPPREAEQPTSHERREVTEWILAELNKIGRGPDRTTLQMPFRANRVNHADLFSGQHNGPAFSKPRAWRISPYIFDAFANRAFKQSPREFSQPFLTVGDKNFNDYDLLTADEGTIAVLMNTTYKFAGLILGEGKKPIRLRAKNVVPEFLNGEGEPSDRELANVFDAVFQHLMQRDASPQERQTYLEELFKKNVVLGGRKEALRYTIMAIMMSHEFVFRLELGLGSRTVDGRRMLSAQELAYAIAYTLTDRSPDSELRQAVQAGELSTKAEIEKHVRRIVEEKDIEVGDLWGFVRRSSRHQRPFTRAKFLRFFREFFGYHYAVDVFKDIVRNPKHGAASMVYDADVLVLQTLKRDKHVLEHLLTTNEYYMSYKPSVDIKDTVSKDGRRRIRINGRAGANYVDAYNIDVIHWDQSVPQTLPKDQRAGLLTHPSWLVSYSQNFETDPVRRGKWILEHLLAGTVADVPIGVEAQVPENHHQTLRERFSVVNKQECWRCHKKMNPYGYPFEAYNDYGKFRTREMLGDPQLNPDRQEGESRPLNAATVIKNSGDPEIDGQYDNAVEMIHAIAKSNLARQSFIRHIFRFFMGRNETLNDSPTLRAMDAAYVKSEGSFNEVVVTLLLSDSFLYRK